MRVYLPIETSTYEIWFLDGIRHMRIKGNTPSLKICGWDRLLLKKNLVLLIFISKLWRDREILF
jgi:hypothetical protein